MTLRPDPEEAPASPDTEAALKLWVVLSRAQLVHVPTGGENGSESQCPAGRSWRKR